MKHNAVLLDNVCCKACGWPVVSVCCNNEMNGYGDDEDTSFDYWTYCSNKGCIHHEGEGWCQAEPSFIRGGVNDF